MPYDRYISKIVAQEDGINIEYAVKDEEGRAALAELINSGSKNVLNTRGLQTQTISGVTCTVNSDFSFTFTGKNTGSSAAFFSVPVSIPKGSYYFSGMPDSGSSSTYRMELRSGSATGSVYKTLESNSPVELVLENDWNGYFNIRVATNYNFGTTGAVLKPMICLQAAWNITDKFVPYNYHEDMQDENLAELVDSGAKNAFYFDSFYGNVTEYTTAGVKFTLNSDGSVTATRESASSSAANASLRISGNLKYIDDYCNGDFVLSGCPSGGGASTYEVAVSVSSYIKRDYGDGVLLTDRGNVSNIYAQCIVRSGFSGTVTFKPMICSKAAWAVSHKYVPYIPSMAQMYAMIQALQNGT